MRIAITAAAVRTALGDDPGAVWRAIRDGQSAVGPIEGFDASGFGDVRAAQIWKEPETPEDDPALRILGSHGRLLDDVAREAHAAAGLASLAREDVGLFVGMGMIDAPIDDLRAAALASRGSDGALDLASFFAGNYRQIHPLWPLSMLNNVAVGQVAIDLDIRGDNVVFAADGAAGVRALLEAAFAVDEGACRAAVAAGVSGRIGPASLARRAFAGLDDPLGEGGAALVLEREQDALRRGAAVLGIIRGGATQSGGLARPRVRPNLPLGDLGAGSAATEIALELAAWTGTPGRALPRTARVMAGGSDLRGLIQIEEAA